MRDATQLGVQARCFEYVHSNVDSTCESSLARPVRDRARETLANDAGSIGHRRPHDIVASRSTKTSPDDTSAVGNRWVYRPHALRTRQLQFPDARAISSERTRDFTAE